MISDIEKEEKAGISKKAFIVHAILMQNGDGIISKSPSYIKEKWDELIESEKPENLLDTSNKIKYNEYMKKWRI